MRDMSFWCQKAKLTIVQISRLGVDRPLNDSKFDFVKLFTFDADSLRQAQFGIFKYLVLCFVNKSPAI